MPSKQFHDLMAMMSARGLNEKLGVDLLRKGFERIARLFNDPGEAECTEVPANGVPSDWIVPAGSREHTALLFLHGGGYIMGSRNTHRGLAARIARASRMHAIVPEYRLAPEYPFPAAVEDALAVYEWVLEQGIEPNHVALAGDSAGGGLTLALLLTLRDRALPLPACAACLSPWTDMEATGASVQVNSVLDPLLTERLLVKAAGAYLNGASASHPYASPFHADFSGLPPLLIHVGGREVLLNDATRAAEKAQDAGVDVTLEVWEDMTHVWHYFAPLLPEGQEAVEKIGKFILAHTT
ncbi:MAG: alpha/beta hydrolase [Candidatus Hydrogenedentota bacterium]